MPSHNTYEEVTNRIVELLEAGTIPWRKPWRTGSPRSLMTDRPYRGVNALMLSAAPYESPYWVTFDQARLRGGYVKRGEKSWPLVFWKVVEQKDKTSGETVDSYPVLRRWSIFNVEQCEGLAYPRPEPRPFNDIAQAECIVAAMPNLPTILHEGGNRAFYRPSKDTVFMPVKARFDSEPEYYSTLFHELTHSTGHPTRLNRPDVMTPAFGTDPYAKEELVAEMGAAMLCSQAALAPATLENSAAYIGGWLQMLRDDHRLVVQAAAAAQKAADFILRIGVPAEEPAPV